MTTKFPGYTYDELNRLELDHPDPLVCDLLAEIRRLKHHSDRVDYTAIHQRVVAAERQADRYLSILQDLAAAAGIVMHEPSVSDIYSIRNLITAAATERKDVVVFRAGKCIYRNTLKEASHVT